MKDEKEFVAFLEDILNEFNESDAFEIIESQSLKERFLTNDEGLYLRLANGKAFNITVQEVIG